MCGMWTPGRQNPAQALVAAQNTGFQTPPDQSPGTSEPAADEGFELGLYSDLCLLVIPETCGWLIAWISFCSHYRLKAERTQELESEGLGPSPSPPHAA